MPKSIDEVPNWCIVNALRCPIEAQISIVAKLLQHLDADQREKALDLSGVFVEKRSGFAGIDKINKVKNG